MRMRKLIIAVTLVVAVLGWAAPAGAVVPVRAHPGVNTSDLHCIKVDGVKWCFHVPPTPN